MKYYITVLCAALLFGCKPEDQSTSVEPTAQDVATALQMQFWTVKIPDDFPSSKRAALMVSYNGEEKELMDLGSEGA